MGTFGIWQWVIVLVIVLLLFGRGKIPGLMGDMAKGLKAFRKGMRDDDEDDEKERETPKSLSSESSEPRNVTPSSSDSERKDEASKA